MERRQFMKLLAMSGMAGLVPIPRRAEAAPYEGPFYINIMANGGWDVTSFCDPKENTPGQPVINHWSSDGGTTQTITGSPIRYAPFAHNSRFFERFRNDMLVVNGIDAQTNAHDAGIRHCWSGQLAKGYPSIGALISAAIAPDQPMAYISNGGYKETDGLISYTLLNDPNSLRNLILSNQVHWDNTPLTFPEELTIIERYQQERLERQRADTTALPRKIRSMNALHSARENRDELLRLQNYIPDEIVSNTDADNQWNPLLRQAQIALIAFQAGVAACCDLTIAGFDTHTNHDDDQEAELRRLINGIEYLWDAAESVGLAEQLRVFITSDFGRTPLYNDDNGKDHWPIGSAIFMQRNAPWGNRVVGATDEVHNGLTINPNTLQLDSTSSGIMIQPKHIHDALRRWATIDQHALVQPYNLDAESLDIFNPNLNTNA